MEIVILVRFGNYLKLSAKTLKALKHASCNEEEIYFINHLISKL